MQEPAQGQLRHLLLQKLLQKLAVVMGQQGHAEWCLATCSAQHSYVSSSLLVWQLLEVRGQQGHAGVMPWHVLCTAHTFGSCCSSCWRWGGMWIMPIGA